MLIKSRILTIIKNVTIPIIISGQKTNIGLNNFYIDN